MCFLPLKLFCVSWSNQIALSFPRNQSAPLRPAGKNLQVLVEPNLPKLWQHRELSPSSAWDLQQGEVVWAGPSATGMILWERRADPWG